MSERRQVWETLSNLLHRVEASTLTSSTVSTDRVEQELRKLGKTQFKANALAEEQTARLQKALDAVQLAQQENARLLDQLQEKNAVALRKDLLEAILPALDGVDNAIASGKRYLNKRDLAARLPDLTPTQAVLARWSAVGA